MTGDPRKTAPFKATIEILQIRYLLNFKMLRFLNILEAGSPFRARSLRSIFEG